MNIIDAANKDRRLEGIRMDDAAPTPLQPNDSLDALEDNLANLDMRWMARLHWGQNRA